MPGMTMREWVPMSVSTKAGDWYGMSDGVCFNAFSLQSLAKTQTRPINSSFELATLSPSDPAARKYRRVKGTVLVLVIHHGFPYSVENIGHTAQTAYPTFEALQQLGRAPDAVLAWQISSRKARSLDFYEKVVQLLGSQGLRTPVFTHDDVGHEDRGICADSAIRLAFLGHKQTAPWFSGEKPRLAFRQRALQGLGIEGSRVPNCKAVIVLREPPQGIHNRDEVESRLRKFMADSGWALTVWRGDTWSADHGGNLRHRVYVSFSDQVSMFHDAALSIMVHGAENVNMVWQPPNAAVVLVVKCGDGGYLTKQFTDPMNFRFFRTHPAGCKEEGFSKFNYSINERSVYDMDVDKDLLPRLLPAIREMEETRVCHPARGQP